MDRELKASWTEEAAADLEAFHGIGSFIMDEKIIVRSRMSAMGFTSDEPWAAISIATHPDTFPSLVEQNRVGLLQMAFWDISGPLDRYDEFSDKIFNEEKAYQILDFVAPLWDGIKTLMVHCEMGMSRSPAIAAALSHIYFGRGSDNTYFNQYTPSREVYKRILRAHYKDLRTDS